MIESWLFIFAVLAVLIIPGPSNALLASAAYHQGRAVTLKFLSIEIIGYVYGIGLWALMMHLSSPVWPMLNSILHIVSAAYVLWAAFSFWRNRDLLQYRRQQPQIKAQQYFLSILKNPKTVLLATGILPLETWNSFQSYFMVMLAFCACAIPSGLFWLHFGRAALEESYSSKLTDRLYKGSAMLLMLCIFPTFIRLF
ncbi:LysE family translocator [Acinetobacter larvae]|uniref:Threonine transporter RhtB n=1 Tax=Acinetobacter larvae TaxID=1789224 RepID=A0A1B2LWL2_9GAMM|nr:threonine transporter RhtB [Acinetobacter larvae]AOA57314.1 threonine transporter RhtB [Acinetobacter larvae]